MTTLYKKDSKGKTRVLNIWVEGDQLIQTAGLLNGSLVENRKTCTPKNVGRANETTGEQQALLELESHITEKLKEDYFRTELEADTIQVILPMLAKGYAENAKKFSWERDPVHLQPKLDGMRALGVCGANASLTSRTGTPITTMPHIIEELRMLPEGIILDGELYSKEIGSFQDNMKAIKKYQKDLSEQVHFNVYDMVDHRSFKDRFIDVIALINQLNTKDLHGPIKLVRTIKATAFSQLTAFHAHNIQNGYEGTMIRWGNEPYKINGRSENLLKYKDFQDIALPILDVVPSEQRPEWGQPIFELNGKRFSSGMRYTHEQRKHWLSNKEEYIGQTAEIRFFEYTDDGLPRFPVVVGIRLDK